MATDSQVKVGTQWRSIGANGIYGHADGSFQDIEYGYSNVNGLWKPTYIKDETPPGLPTNTKVAWENGGLRITWTNPNDADLDKMQLVIYKGLYGSTVATAPIVNASPGANGSYLYTSSSIPNYYIYRVNFRPIDVNGNKSTGSWEASMEFTGYPRGRTPSPISIRPGDSGDWDATKNKWRTVTDLPGPNWRVLQGSSISRTNIGAMFYQSQFWTYFRGANVTSARLDLQRVNSNGTGDAVYPEMYWSDDVTSKAVNPETGNRFNYLVGTGMTRYRTPPNYGSTVLPASWRAAIGSETLAGSLRSILFISNDTTLRSWLGNVSESYMSMYGAGDKGPYFGTYPGLIYVVHSG